MKGKIMKDYFYITSKDEVINRYDGADKKRTVIDENGEPIENKSK